MGTTSSATAEAEAWLCDFGAALAFGDGVHIGGLLAEECHWGHILGPAHHFRRCRHREPYGACAGAHRPRSVALAAEEETWMAGLRRP